MFQTRDHLLRQDARARDALSKGGPGLGRADRLCPRPGQELAADGLRLSGAGDSGSPRRRLAGGTQYHHALCRRGRPARRSSRSRARRPKPTSRPTRRSPIIWRGSSRMSARFRSIRSSCARTGSPPTTTRRPQAANTLNDYRPRQRSLRQGRQEDGHRRGDQRRARLSRQLRCPLARARASRTVRLPQPPAHRAVLTIVLQPPRTEEALRKNPLGIYVHAVNWSRELTPGEDK